MHSKLIWSIPLPLINLRLTESKLAGQPPNSILIPLQIFKIFYLFRHPQFQEFLLQYNLLGLILPYPLSFQRTFFRNSFLFLWFMFHYLKQIAPVHLSIFPYYFFMASISGAGGTGIAWATGCYSCLHIFSSIFISGSAFSTDYFAQLLLKTFL